MKEIQQASKVRFGPFDVDLQTGELRKHGVRLRLAGQPFQILALLVERPGELITREELRSKLWSADTFVDFDHSLNAAVNKLRETLGDSAESPRYVETLPRRGYRIIVPVEAVESGRNGAPIADGSLAKQPDRDSPDGAALPAVPAPAPRNAARWATVAAATALVAVALVIAFGNRIGNIARTAVATPAEPEIRSVAVLPFEDLNKDPQQEYFADGMTEELITHLARFGALRVTSRTSVMQFKGARKPLKEIAAALGVDAVVEGTVRREGNRVRLSAQLIHAGTDKHLWAESYERDLRDVLALQSELAGRIAQQVRVQVNPQERAVLAYKQPLDLDAYQYYLQGKHALDAATPRTKRQAPLFFEQAVAKDPSFAPAWTALAESALFQIPPRTWMPRAKQAAIKALELNSNLPDAHYAMGLVQTMWEWDFAAGEKSFRRALELNPSHAQARHRYAYNLNAQGRLDEAIAQLKRGLEIDPFSDELMTYLGRTYFFARRYDDAEKMFQQALRVNANSFWPHFFRAILHEHQGKYDVAVEEFTKAYSVTGLTPELVQKIPEIYRVHGYEGVHRARMKHTESQTDPAAVGSSAMALMYLRLGEKEKALEWLERSFASHAGDLIYLNVEPQYDAIRSDPRFKDLVRRVGLPVPPAARRVAGAN